MVLPGAGFTRRGRYPGALRIACRDAAEPRARRGSRCRPAGAVSGHHRRAAPGTEDDRGVGFLEDGGSALLIPFLVVIALNLWAAVALWRGRLFGEGIGCLGGGLNVLTVGLLFTVSLLVLLYSGTATFGVISVILAAIALAGCAAAFWLSWRERDAVA